jgi:hypothetical protein
MPQCKARTKTCRKCEHRYSKDEYELWECPECGEPRQCQRPANTGYEVCQVHGGGSPHKGRFPGNPPKKGKPRRYHLPTGLIERYETALEDPDLLSLRDDLAVVEARIGTLLENINELVPGDTWDKLQKEWSDFQDAQALADTEAMKASLHKIGKLITKGHGEWARWREVATTQEHRRKLTETEATRLHKLHQMITVERALAIADHWTAALIEGMEKYIPDLEQRRLVGGYVAGAMVQVMGTAGSQTIPAQLMGYEVAAPVAR